MLRGREGGREGGAETDDKEAAVCAICKKTTAVCVCVCDC